jgi:predicted alpha/beta hydrolase family esterase
MATAVATTGPSDAQPTTERAATPVDTPATLAVLPMPRRALLIPDGETDAEVPSFDLVDDLWYGLAAEAVRDHGIKTVVPTFPDRRNASSATWIPFLRSVLHIDSDTLVIAHGTGAACLQRMLSDGVKCAGAILIAPFDTHMDDPREIQAGYFAAPFDVAEERANCPWFCVMASDDDPFVPYEASQRVAESLDATMYRLTNNGHFVTRHHPELITAIQQTLSARFGPALGRPADNGRYTVADATPVIAPAESPNPQSCLPLRCIVA